jgi:hypothetical protein
LRAAAFASCSISGSLEVLFMSVSLIFGVSGRAFSKMRGVELSLLVTEGKSKPSIFVDVELVFCSSFVHRRILLEEKFVKEILSCNIYSFCLFIVNSLFITLFFVFCNH